MMNIYKNDPKYKSLFMSKNHPFVENNMQIEKYKIRMDNKNTKSLFLHILIKSIQSGVKSVYDRG
ncbi:hypothetical protein C6497_05465 [Candidatus Poribacteria bacterium]|nr:MAG: hypothetical protein C6497_05465 [Candidatus Poribacteria bacterium]